MNKTKQQQLPGFNLTLGITVLYMSFFIGLPGGTFLFSVWHISLTHFIDIIFSKQVLHAYYVSFLCSFIAMLVNAIFGLLLAWVLVRYKFWGRRIIDGFIDLPFALPTAVAGIALTNLSASTGWFGQVLYEVGITSAYSLVGITIALIFVGLPFVVRTVQPVLKECEKDYEEVAYLMGASSLQVFKRVILPEIQPALFIGSALAFSRSIGEYGSVIFIAGNLPFKTEIAPVVIMSRLE
ncbi:MAG: sulfate ABC transporter permease subunit CysT [Veillonellaceae bacterium]|nr:sulfate ABC transporter permease subunit CysT [Veillonellaceae bacterium]